jgi:hypothetical protein
MPGCWPSDADHYISPVERLPVTADTGDVVSGRRTSTRCCPKSWATTSRAYANSRRTMTIGNWSGVNCRCLGPRCVVPSGVIGSSVDLLKSTPNSGGAGQDGNEDQFSLAVPLTKTCASCCSRNSWSNVSAPKEDRGEVKDIISKVDDQLRMPVGDVDENI